ncbi:cytosolic sulfotransferase 15-like [Phragmites australis]|uniref:cytosolic sulfotransferase 15-like n=1 Tax=Phragmites australis TaxID=29695 RepID=UPI002D798E7C|nr:cytosolic sulfotransferase 15-like [Phragmites australis]
MAQAQSDTKRSGGPEEGESLTSTLPMREGWWRPFFLVQGCWLTPQAAKSVELVQAQFQPRSDDIILATFPKCGTTWLKALAFTIANRSRHTVTSHGHPLLTNHPQDLVPFLEIHGRALHPVEELEALPSPRLLSTHLPYALLPSNTSALGCRVVYLCREPKDVLVSTWHYINKVRRDFFIELDKAFEFFCEGVSLYGPIWEHYLGYWKQSMIEPNRILFLKYDELMADPSKHVKMLAEFLRVPFTDVEVNTGVVEEVVRLCSFENLKGVTDRIGGLPMENSSFFRSAKVGD